MQIVIIGGLPCSGKSLLATRLRAKWPRPLLSKDEFKESLFATLGSSDRAWSRRVSKAAYELMFRQAEELASCGNSFVIEGNFRERDHRHRIDTLSTFGASLLQVHCRAQPDVLVSRFAERMRLKSRHPGHADSESFSELEAEIRASQQVPMTLEGELVECDTTDAWSTAIDTAVDRTLARLSP